MGYALVERLLDAGCDVAVYNRTRAKAEPLTGAGATIVDSPSDLADRDIVFTMVGGSDDYREVVLSPNGILANAGQKPKVIVDSTTVSLAVAEDVREQAAKVGVEIVAANVSGNPSVVGSGLLTVVASGNPQAFDYVEPYLNHYGRGVIGADPVDPELPIPINRERADRRCRVAMSNSFGFGGSNVAVVLEAA